MGGGDREAIDANTECYRLLDAMCQSGSLGTLHEVTDVGPRHLAASGQTREFIRLMAVCSLQRYEPKKEKKAEEKEKPRVIDKPIT